MIGGSTAPVSRPRRPGTRRASAVPPLSQADDEENRPPSSSGLKEQLEPPKAPRRTTSAPQPSQALDVDLDLDLPVDLTAVLQQNALKWSTRRRSPSELNRGFVAAAKTEVPEYFSEPAMQNTSDGSGNGSPVLSRTRAGWADPDEGVSAGSAHDDDDEDHDQDACSPAEDGQNRWVGSLPREELEALLVQANRVIQERERDLGIAAAIGQALLEKNMSLRQKHTGIMSRLSTAANLAALAEQSGGQPNSPPTTDYDAESVRDDAVSDVGDTTSPRFEDEDSTPMPTPVTPSSDYFAGLPGSSPTARRRPHFEGIFASTSSASVSSAWQPNEEGLVPSAPGSPHQGISYDGPRHYRNRRGHTSSSGSQAAAAAAAQAAETQRQLEMLSGQNDNLLSQLAELQNEAEDAKRSGGKRLRQLNKEIAGLRAELDAATRRNDELEGGAGFADGGLSPLPPKRSPWARRQRSDEARLPQPSPSRAPYGSHQAQDRPLSTASTATSQEGEDDNGDAASVHSLGGMSASESISAQSEVSHAGASLESVLRSGSSSQRRLVAQLLTKIKELEETNMALARAGTEMDGRIGKFLEEGERIRDAYDAVESANQAAIPPSESASSNAVSSDTHGLGGLSPSQLSSTSIAGLSPAARRRRAPGNRYIIEGRRTIRNAMRRESASRSAQDGKAIVGAMPRSVTLESLASSTASSSASSPTSVRMKRMPSGLMRPRILITPSMEDLAARRQHDAEQPEVGRSAGGPSRRRLGERRDPSAASDTKLMPSIELGGGQSHRDRQRRDSVSSVTDGQQSVDASPCIPRSDTASILSRYDSITMQGSRTLGSELGSVFGEDEEEQETQGQGINDAEASQLIAWQGNLPKRRASPNSRRLRPTASSNSMRAGSEADSDVADLRWSVGSSATVMPAGSEEEGRDNSQYDYARRHGLIGYGQDMDAEVSIDAELLRQLSAQADGEWPSPGENIIPRGALRDQGITGHEAESYDLIETATRRRPIHWADDDDYGQPITESEARRLGLMAPKGSLRRGLLGWRTVLGLQSRSLKGKQRDRHERTMSTLGSRTDLAQIESAEQIAEREKATEMLRLKRVAALKARVQAGQLSPTKAIALGMRSYDYENEEREATQRAFAMSPARRRHAMRYEEEHDDYNFPASGSGRRLDAGRSPNRTRSSTTSSGTVRGDSPRKARRGTLQRLEPDDEDARVPEEKESSDEQFELLDLDPAKRRPGRRGTDYYPVSYRARYRPTMVKERVKVASGEAITWATAWMSFSAIMIFAFIVAFTRGPKRILGANQQH